MVGNQIWYHIKEGFRSIFTHGLMSFASVCMIVACLLIMGSFSLIAVNANEMLKELEDENEFLAYVDDSYDDKEARSLQKRLEAVSNVSSVEFISKAQAMENFKSKQTNNDNFKDLPAELLRDRYSIHVEDIQAMESTVDEVKNVSGIADVKASLEIADGFVMLRNVASALAIILVVMLVIISVFIIANTIKLATFYRREEIAIMKMCGATNAFVQWPFVVEGLLLGLTGALVAFFAQWGIYQLVGKLIIQGNGLSLVTMLSYQSMMKNILATFCGTGALIGVGGSLLAIRKFLQV